MTQTGMQYLHIKFTLVDLSELSDTDYYMDAHNFADMEIANYYGMSNWNTNPDGIYGYGIVWNRKTIISW